LYALLIPVLLLVGAVGRVAFGLDPIADPSTWVRFLAFVEKVVADPIVKTFVLLNATEDFWRLLEEWVTPDRCVVCGRVSARIFRIFARLSDFSASIRPACLGGQRLVFDCLSGEIIARLCDALNGITDSDRPDRGVLAMSALELILSWCDPPPVAVFAATRINPSTIKTLRKMGGDAGEVFSEACADMSAVITRKLDDAVVMGDPEELQSVQGEFAGQPDAAERKAGLFINWLCGMEAQPQ
jgi:hypothetical protein